MWRRWIFRRDTGISLLGKRDKSEPAPKPEFSELYGTWLACKVLTLRRSPSTKIIRKLRLEGLRVLKEQILRIGEVNFRSNMRILQGNLPKHIPIFAFQNQVRIIPSCLRWNLCRKRISSFLWLQTCSLRGAEDVAPYNVIGIGFIGA